MKKILLCLLFAMCSTLSFGQYFHETEIGSGTVLGNSVIVRNCDDTLVVMYNYDLATSSGEHRFTIRNLNNSSTVSFKLRDACALGFNPFPMAPAPSSGDTLLLIKDMEIYERVCYFCGAFRVTTGNFLVGMDGQITYETAYTGLVGKFSIDDILTGSAQYELASIPKTALMTKMTVYNASQGMSISMIGSADPSTVYPSSCVVDIYPNGPTTWECSASNLTSSDELFCDIGHAFGSVIAVSRLKNEHHKFVLRASKAAWILTDPTSCFSTPRCFSTQTANIISNPTILPTYRAEADSLVLYGCDMRNDFFVAHPCCNTHFGTVFYRMGIDHPCETIVNLSNQYALENDYVRLTDMRYINNNTADALYALTRNVSGNQSGIQLMSFLNTADYIDYYFTDPNKSLHDLDIINNTAVLFGGTYPGSNSIFQDYYAFPHYSPVLFPRVRCMTYYPRNNYILNPINSCPGGDDLAIFCNRRSITWNSFTVEKDMLTNTLKCF